MVYFNRLFESSGLRISMCGPAWLSCGALLMGVYTIRDLIRDGQRLLFWPAEKLAEEDRRNAMARFNPPLAPKRTQSRRRRRNSNPLRAGRAPADPRLLKQREGRCLSPS